MFSMFVGAGAIENDSFFSKITGNRIKGISSAQDMGFDFRLAFADFKMDAEERDAAKQEVKQVAKSLGKDSGCDRWESCRCL